MVVRNQIIMNSFTSIRHSSISYNIQPIQEKQQEQEEFVPYAKQKLRMNSIVSDSYEFQSLGKSLSQSLECKNNPALKAKRFETLNKSEGKSLLNSLMINNSQQLFPRVIHSTKKLDKKALEKQDSKKSRLLKLQGEMRKLKPSFFKQITHLFGKNQKKPMRVLHLDAMRKSNFLLEDKKQPKEVSKVCQLSGKDLKKLMRIQKMQQSLQPITTPQISRIKHNQIV